MADPDPKPAAPPADPLAPTLPELRAELAEAKKALVDGQAWAKAEIDRLTKEIAELKPKPAPPPAAADPAPAAPPAAKKSELWWPATKKE